MIDQAAEAFSKPAMYGGGAMAGSSWAACKWPFLQSLLEKLGATDMSEFVGVAGLCIALAGFVMNLIFNIRRDRRERAAMRMP